MFAVIGDPVGHSVSPALHSAVFSRLDLGATGYGRALVKGEGLEAFARGMREGAFCGVNVTLPHKRAIVPFLDELRGDALVAGAVNTVVREGLCVAGERSSPLLVGHNTDMEGLCLAIRSLGYDYKGAVVCIFGTGGAALGAAVKAAGCGATEVRVVGRDPAKAREVAERAGGAAFSISDLGLACEGADVFLQATPLGMAGFAGGDFEDVSFLSALPRGALVYDVVYTPIETTLVRAARRMGLAAETGLSMLVWQGLVADTLFLPAAGHHGYATKILSDDMAGFVYNRLKKELCGK